MLESFAGVMYMALVVSRLISLTMLRRDRTLAVKHRRVTRGLFSFSGCTSTEHTGRVYRTDDFSLDVNEPDRAHVLRRSRGAGDSSAKSTEERGYTCAGTA